MTGERLHICHLSADFPDPVNSAKTSVIQRLVTLTNADFEHEVYSLNRAPPSPARFLAGALANYGKPALQIVAEPFSYGHALRYYAPGQGVLHAQMLRELGDWLAERIAAGRRPDLLVGHKLSVEGIATARAASRLGLPYALSLQGNTDTKILQLRPDLRPALTEVYHSAAMVFPFAPWARTEVERYLGVRSGPSVLLPCPMVDEHITPPNPNGAGVISVFHLRNAREKNLAGLALAARKAREYSPDLTLQIVGGGTPAEIMRCNRLAGGAKNVEFPGALDGEALRSCMNNAAGLVLPSLRESFGLVFIEALFAGLPIAYPAGAAVDGYLDDLPFAIRVNARSTSDITAAMIALVTRQVELKEALSRWQQSGATARFCSKRIAQDFRDGLIAAANVRPSEPIASQER